MDSVKGGMGVGLYLLFFVVCWCQVCSGWGNSAYSSAFGDE